MNLGLPEDATAEQASAWLRQLVRDLGLGFHLDTRPDDFLFSNGTPCFTAEECSTLNRSLERLFTILGDVHADDIAADVSARLLAEALGWKPPLQYHDPGYQKHLLSDGTRDELIGWLIWNDPHGTYADPASVAEDHSPLTLDEARAILRDQIERA